MSSLSDLSRLPPSWRHWHRNVSSPSDPVPPLTPALTGYPPLTADVWWDELCLPISRSWFLNILWCLWNVFPRARKLRYPTESCETAPATAERCWPRSREVGMLISVQHLVLDLSCMASSPSRGMCVNIYFSQSRLLASCLFQGRPLPITVGVLIFFLLYHAISTKAMAAGSLKHLGLSRVGEPYYMPMRGAHHGLGWEPWEAALVPCGIAAVSLNGYE